MLAHSDHLDEVSHGAASGRVRDLSLDALRDVAPELPTFDDALAFFVDEAPGVGLHVDLKLRTRLDELAHAIVRHGLEARTVVSGVHVASLQAVARAAPRVRVGITYPEDRLSISRKPYLWPIVSLGLASMRASVPLRLPRLARRAGASAVMLQHRLVTESSVERAHAAGLPVLAWTVDEPADLDRVVAAGVDGVITNDPRIFVATLTRVNRGVTIAALSACGAAGVVAAVMLAAAPSAGADDGTTTAPATTTAPTTHDDGAATTTAPTTRPRRRRRRLAAAAEADRRRRHDRRHARRRPDRGRGEGGREGRGSPGRSRSSEDPAPASS